MLVAYSDIVYKAEHVAKLSQSHEDITILYDTDWLALWSLRFSDPLSDAETFEETDGFLRDIGRKASSLAEIKGQYMGLLRFSSAGINRVREYVNGLAPEVADKLDMTSLLRGLLTNGTNIRALPVKGGWCECDTEADIMCYEEALRRGEWTHDWRLAPNNHKQESI